MSSISERIPKRIVQVLSTLLRSFLKDVVMDVFDPWVIVDLIQGVNVTYNPYSYKVFHDLIDALDAESYRPKSKEFIEKWGNFMGYVNETVLRLDFIDYDKRVSEECYIKTLKEYEEQEDPMEEDESDMFSDDEGNSTPSSADPSSIIITKTSKLPPLTIVYSHH